MENFNDLVYGLFNAGPSFINLSHWEQDHPSDNEGTEKSSGPSEESTICEENFWFSSVALSVQVSRPQFWCSCIGRMCADTDSSTWRLPAPNWVHGQYFLRVNGTPLCWTDASCPLPQYQNCSCELLNWALEQSVLLSDAAHEAKRGDTPDNLYNICICTSSLFI